MTLKSSDFESSGFTGITLFAGQFGGFIFFYSPYCIVLMSVSNILHLSTSTCLY